MHAEHLEAAFGVGPHTDQRAATANMQMILIPAHLTMESMMIHLQRSLPASVSRFRIPA